RLPRGQPRFGDCQKTASQRQDRHRTIYIVTRRRNPRGFCKCFQRLLVAYNVKDTLYDENNQQITAFLETTYQTEKKELQIESLQNQRKLYIWLSIASGLLLLTALIPVIIRYRLAVSRRKLAEKESQRLAQEKQ